MNGVTGGKEKASIGALLGGLDTKTAANDGMEVEIMRPDGEPSGLFIKVLGQDSDVYRKITERQDRARMRAIAKGGRGATDQLFDGAKTNEMERVIACCVDWRDAEGREMPFKIGAAGDADQTEQLFTDYPLIYDQVRVAIHDRMNFTKTPATR